jgi:5-methyltetrahydrofolate--homocysteine methyltransferase
MMLEGAGYEMIDTGTDENAGDFVAAVQEQQPQVLGPSALLTTTMVNMRSTIEALDEAAGLRDSVKITISGAPVTSAFQLSSTPGT